MASNTVHAWLKRAMCPAEEEAFLRESEAYAEHLGAALPRLLPAAKRAAQRTGIVELAPETIEAIISQPDKQAQAEQSSVREAANPVLAMEPCKSGAGGQERSSVPNNSPQGLEDEPEQAADVIGGIAPVTAARTPLAPLPEAGSNTQAPSRRTPRKASRHRSTFTFDRRKE